ncbi:MAG: chorismate--pyruvate lyase family protein [Nitrospirota bacterium]
MNILKWKIGNNELSLKELDPFLRVLLITDTTVTKLLEAYFWEDVAVEVLKQKETAVNEEIEDLAVKVGSVVINRQVLLHGKDSKRVYAFAESIINPYLLGDDIRKDLMAGKIGIGEILNDTHIETYREILHLHIEPVGKLSRYLNIGQNETLICREYRIFTKRKPAILIKEKFTHNIT